MTGLDIQARRKIMLALTLVNVRCGLREGVVANILLAGLYDGWVGPLSSEIRSRSLLSGLKMEAPGASCPARRRRAWWKEQNKAECQNAARKAVSE
jgi:hypothetical protein